MFTKNRPKNKIAHRKTKKRIYPVIDETTILSNAANDSVNNPIISKYAHKVETSLTPKNMKEYATLIGIVTEKNISKYGQYSPSINKRLESIRHGKPVDIFGCGIESILRKTKNVDNFDIRIGSDSKGNDVCVSATSKDARDVFMKNFKSNRPLIASKIIVPMQRHSNCWFNTMFICFFVSDKGRKFMRFFRQLMIEGKLVDGSLITPKELSFAFILFNAAIEACYNNGKIKDTPWLALNTNNIIVNIYNSLPSMPGIKNIDEFGNPYNFYRDIMLYIGSKHNSITTELYNKESDVSSFYNSPDKNGITPDIVIVSITDNSNNRLAARTGNYLNKPLRVNYNGSIYEIDSVISRDITKQHFCCGITCNSEDYLFDGGAFSRLSKRNWRKWINKDLFWRTHGSTGDWNFTIGYSMFFYYRIS